jgi:Domain of unknown function (DUF3576)
MSARSVALSILAASLLAGCGVLDTDMWSNGKDPDAIKRAQDPYHTDPKYADPEAYNPRIQDGTDDRSIIASLFGGGKDSNGNGGPPGVGVNSLLWRATLDTVSFMPLASADPFGGVIITDWYSPPNTPNERFKVNVFILGRELRADGIRASVFHQHRDNGGQWVDASVDQATGTDIENAILTRARQMRLSTASK